MLQSAHVLFNLWRNSTLFCILTLFISKLPKHAPFSIWFYRSFRYNPAELGSSCLKTFWLRVLAQCTWSHKNNDWGCSQEAGGLHAAAQPVHAISLLLAKLVRHSAPYPFVSWKCEGLTPQRSTIDNKIVMIYYKISAWKVMIFFFLPRIHIVPFYPLFIIFPVVLHIG
jgi:hypothetical protein